MTPSRISGIVRRFESEVIGTKIFHPKHIIVDDYCRKCKFTLNRSFLPIRTTCRFLLVLLVPIVSRCPDPANERTMMSRLTCLKPQQSKPPTSASFSLQLDPIQNKSAPADPRPLRHIHCRSAEPGCGRGSFGENRHRHWLRDAPSCQLSDDGKGQGSLDSTTILVISQLRCFR